MNTTNNQIHGVDGGDSSSPDDVDREVYSSTVVDVSVEFIDGGVSIRMILLSFIIPGTTATSASSPSVNNNASCANRELANRFLFWWSGRLTTLFPNTLL